MGRSSSGRSGGGGSFGSGGGRSFGGRSSTPGRSGSGFNNRNININLGGGFYGRRYYGSIGGNNIVTFVLFVLIIIFFVFSKWSVGRVTPPTVKREPLAAEQCAESDTWYIDNADWIIDKRKLTEGLQHFYKKTGVQPLLMIEEGEKPVTEEIEALLRDTYDKLYDDEGHFIYLYWDTGNGYYHQYYYAGLSAKQVMDSEATDILMDYVDRYTTTDMTDEEMFSTAFSKAGDAIMKKSVPAGLIIGITAIVMAGVVGCAFFAYKKAEADRKKAEIDRDILNSDL